MEFEFGYDKQDQELIIYKNGDDIGRLRIRLNDEEIRTFQEEVKKGTYFIIHDKGKMIY